MAELDAPGKTRLLQVKTLPLAIESAGCWWEPVRPLISNAEPKADIRFARPETAYLVRSMTTPLFIEDVAAAFVNQAPLAKSIILTKLADDEILP